MDFMPVRAYGGLERVYGMGYSNRRRYNRLAVSEMWISCRKEKGMKFKSILPDLLLRIAIIILFGIVIFQGLKG